MVCPMNDHFQRALDYHTYCFADRLAWYGDEAVRSLVKWAKLLLVQMKSQMLELFELVFTISVLFAFKLECDTNSVQEGATLWLLHFYMVPPAAALKGHIELRSKLQKHKKKAQRHYTAMLWIFHCRRNRQKIWSTWPKPTWHLLDRGQTKRPQSTPKRYGIRWYDAKGSILINFESSRHCTTSRVYHTQHEVDLGLKGDCNSLQSSALRDLIIQIATWVA